MNFLKNPHLKVGLISRDPKLRYLNCFATILENLACLFHLAMMTKWKKKYINEWQKCLKIKCCVNLESW